MYIYLIFKLIIVAFIPTLVIFPICYLFAYTYVITNKEKYYYISILFFIINYILCFLSSFLIVSWEEIVHSKGDTTIDLIFCLLFPLLSFMDYFYSSFLSELFNTNIWLSNKRIKLSTITTDMPIRFSTFLLLRLITFGGFPIACYFVEAFLILYNEFI